MNFIIRPARKNDCEDIMRMSMELGEHEGMPEQVLMTAADLKKDGFGEEPKFQCFVAEETTPDGSGEGRIVIGYSLYNFSYNSWEGQYCFMDELYITSGWRRRGVGTALIAEVVKTALAKGCSLLKWMAMEVNKPAMDLYKHLGGIDITVKEKLHMFKMTKPVMEQLVSESE